MDSTPWSSIKEDGAEEEVVAAKKVNASSIQAKASTKVVDDTIVHRVIINLTNIGVMDETPEASNATITDEIEHNTLKPTSKLSTTSNKANSKDKGEPNVVIVYSTSSDPTPLNYAQPATVTWDQVQDMIEQAIESFAKWQCQDIEQFKLSMQNAITT